MRTTELGKTVHTVRRVVLILVVNLALLVGLLGLVEIGVRAWEHGSLASALGALFGDEPTRFGSTRRTPNWLTTDPVLGYRVNSALEGVNSLGIRAPEIEVPKPPGVFRIVVLGDSVSWSKNGYVTMLRERLTERYGESIEVINASIPGYTTFQERMLLERDLIPTQPDLVLVQYCMNDNHRFLHYVDRSGQWLVTKEAMHGFSTGGDNWLEWLTRHSATIRRIRFALADPVTPAPGPGFQAPHNPHFGPAWTDEGWETAERQLRAMRDLARENGAAFAILMPPIRGQLEPAWLEEDADYVLEPQRRMADLAERENIPLLDLHTPFFGAAPDTFFRDPVHFTQRAHRATNEEVLHFLRSEDLLPD